MKNQGNISISANTKIGALLKLHPGALEAIIRISPKFSKLRNPVLRKLIASRTSIATAAKLGGCTVEEFFQQLEPLGFDVDHTVIPVAETGYKKVPVFIKTADPARIVALDVRPILESAKDPLDIILKELRGLKPGYILKIINSFEPTPLIRLLGKKGFESYSEFVHEELVNTYFHKISDSSFAGDAGSLADQDSWEKILERFKGNLESIDVRNLEMPLPMHAILEALDHLPQDKALYVYHKRIPVFLLPEIEDRQFSYRIREINESEVHLLIFKE
jgi:uncharacterized protein (DUF2249 family)